MMKKLLLGISLTISPLQAVVYDQPKVVNGNDLALLLSGPIDQSKLALAPLIERFPGDTVRIIIDSPGGSMLVSSRIIQAIEQRKAGGSKVECIVKGWAASAAFSILTHCSKRIVIAESYLLFHDPRFITTGPEVLDLEKVEVLHEELQRLYNTELKKLIKVLPMDPGLVKKHYDLETLFDATELDSLLLDQQWMEVYPALRIVSTEPK